MRARLVRIGNSRGIRIPKPLLDEIGLDGEVELELEIEGGRLVIRRVAHPREGWDNAFRMMAARGDDRALLPEGSAPSDFDRSEWEWK